MAPENDGIQFNQRDAPFHPGMILYEEANITGQSMHQIARRGLVRTFQLPTLFNNFTVLKNMLMGMHLHAEMGFWRSLLGTSYTKKRESEVLGRALEILQEVGLFARKDEVASNLAHGHRRILQVAVGLGCQPGLLLLDEPMTGMNMQEVQEMMGLIKKLRDNRGVTIALVEHNIRAVMDLCDRIAVLNFGQKIAEGAPGDISQNQAVIQAYLGGSL